MSRRTADIISPGFANLFVLNKADLYELTKEYPAAQKAIKECSSFPSCEVHFDSFFRGGGGGGNSYIPTKRGTRVNRVFDRVSMIFLLTILKRF